MQRFYLYDLNTSNYNFTLVDTDIIHQLTKVLRVKVSDEIIFFNGQDNFDYVFKIKQIERNSMLLEQINRIKNETETDFAVNLYQAMPNKQEKIEYILQKAVEIWVKNIVFFKAERSQKLLLTEKKIERFNKIVFEAVEQSGRAFIPEIVFLEKPDFSPIKHEQNMFFHTESSSSVALADLELDYKKTINIFIWPEWGFSPDEITRFLFLWFRKSFLWARILRTETRAITVPFFIIQNYKSEKSL